MKTWTTPPNPHEAVIIANADRYSAFVFGGRFNRNKQVCQTLDEARAAGARMAGEIGRPAMIYAICGDRSAFVENVPVPAGA